MPLHIVEVFSGHYWRNFYCKGAYTAAWIKGERDCHKTWKFHDWLDDFLWQSQSKLFNLFCFASNSLSLDFCRRQLKKVCHKKVNNPPPPTVYLNYTERRWRSLMGSCCGSQNSSRNSAFFKAIFISVASNKREIYGNLENQKLFVYQNSDKFICMFK